MRRFPLREDRSYRYPRENQEQPPLPEKQEKLAKVTDAVQGEKEPERKVEPGLNTVSGPRYAEETKPSPPELTPDSQGSTALSSSPGELATAYVPWQVYTRIFEPREALQIGSIFPELVRTPPLYRKPRE